MPLKKIIEQLTCDVCKKREAVGIAASSCGPVSFAYCRSCLSVGAEPYGALVCYLAGAGSDGPPQSLNEFAADYHWTIYATCLTATKTAEQFWSDLREEWNAAVLELES